jgi:16S rRNA (guanine(966)-N(2))-methyltransferase RsmD
MLRILAGEYRSRRLISPDNAETSRPYLNRVKESVFNILREWCDDAVVLDLFAGVGTMGLETASRGARSVVCVEKSKRIFGLLKRNIETLQCADRVVGVHGDALGSACLLRSPQPVDLVFMDPPYAMMRDEHMAQRVLGQIQACRDVMDQAGYVVLRSPKGGHEVDLAVAGFQGPESHQYRPDQWVHLYSPV